MKFTVSSQVFKEAVATANATVATNPSLPILEGINFSLEDGSLTITGTDLQTYIQTSIDVQEERSGAVVVPAKILFNTLKALPTQPIVFEANTQNLGISIETSNGKYALVGQDSDDFPRLPEKAGLESFSLSADVLATALNKTVFACSTDELRPAMTAVLFELKAGNLNFVATDAHKLVKYTVKGLDLGELDTTILPPAGPLKSLAGALANEVGEVEVAFNNQQVFFSFGKQRFIIRQIDARYPDWRSVVPTNNDKVATLERSKVMSSLKRVVTYANKETNQVVLDFNKSDLTIISEDIDFSNKASETIETEFDQKMKIAFNGKYLLEVLKSFDSDEVELAMSEPSRAGLISPADKEDNIDHMALIMPMMLH